MLLNYIILVAAAVAWVLMLGGPMKPLRVVVFVVAALLASHRSHAAPADELPVNRSADPAQVACLVGYTKTVRPPAAVTGRIKTRLMREQAIPPELRSALVLDHVLPLVLLGSPDDRCDLRGSGFDLAARDV